MDFVPVTLVTILFISQIIVGIYFLSEVAQIQILAYVVVVVVGWDLHPPPRGDITRKLPIFFVMNRSYFYDTFYTS
jgi:hypothetical protein